MRSSDAMAELAAAVARPRKTLRALFALRLLDAAIVMLRVAAILVLLSPFLGVAILLG